MKIGLFDIDSKIPNLALMKIATYHKEQGHDVDFYDSLWLNSYDKIYASKVFKYSSSAMIIPERMTVGGTGLDKDSTLPEDIDTQPPDYDLYVPESFPGGERHSIGFTMRGCRFACKFCVVPQKEGKPKSVTTIKDLWRVKSSRFLYLLDNDFFGNPHWRDRIKEIRDYNLKVTFSQGLNIRIITDEQAKALTTIDFTNSRFNQKYLNFAWDRFRDKKRILEGIERCKTAGIKPHQMMFFVLIGYDTTHEENMERVTLLNDLGCLPFVMPYNKDDRYQKRFARWVNHKATFKSVAWEDYAY